MKILIDRIIINKKIKRLKIKKKIKTKNKNNSQKGLLTILFSL